MKITNSLLAQLPKVELHCHLDGSLRVDTILDLANKNKIKFPHTNKIIRSMPNTPGQIGAGITKAPADCFSQAVIALAKTFSN